jgi:hypothetical protein
MAWEGRGKKRTPAGTESALDILESHVRNVCARLVHVIGAGALVLVIITSPTD